VDELQQWIFPQRYFQERLKLGEGGEEGRDNDIVRATFERTVASVMGERMFDLGEQARGLVGRVSIDADTRHRRVIKAVRG
jgi:hypothetical protein